MAAGFITVLMGLAMRWAMTGSLILPVSFDDLRHAHSHLGYFGLLIPLAWLGWRHLDAEIPGRRLLLVYALATVLSWLGFLRRGYGPEAIGGSTVVAAVWLWSAWQNRARLTNLSDPLGMMIPGLVLSVACVPPIAYFLRRDPALAQGFVSSFLALLLLGVVVPTALAIHRRRIAPWPALLVAAILSAAALGVAPYALTRLGLVAYGAMAGSLAIRRTEAIHHRVGWGALGVGLLALGLEWVPNNRPVAIGALHFVILGPLAASLTEPWLRRVPPAWAWLIGLAGVSTMSGALLMQGFGRGGTATFTWAAIGGTFVVVWWLLVLGWQLAPEPHEADRA